MCIEKRFEEYKLTVLSTELLKSLNRGFNKSRDKDHNPQNAVLFERDLRT